MKQERERPITRREFLAVTGGLVGGITLGALIPEIVWVEMRNRATRELKDLHTSITTDYYDFPIKVAKVNEDPSVAGIYQTFTTNIGPFQLGLNKDGTRTMKFKSGTGWRDYIIKPTEVFQTGEISAFPSGKKFPYRLRAEEIRELSALLSNVFHSGNPPKDPGVYHVSRYPIRLQ